MYSIFIVFILSVLLLVYIYNNNNNRYIRRQSPIHIQGKVKSFQNTILETELFSKKIQATLLYKKNTIYYKVKNTIITMFNNTPYVLSDFHFHKPSEHVIHNKRYDMEVHFVHKKLYSKGESYNEQFVVFSFFIQKGNTNVLDTCIELQENVEIQIPEHNTFYYYPGSLTTPPYSSNVSWIVFDTPISSSTIPILDTNYNTARPVQKSIQGELMYFQ